MANKIILKKGLQANLPTLEVGEPAFTTDTGNLYIGSSEGNVKFISNTSTSGTVIDVSTIDAALRVTQRGTGLALSIEDSTNPDSTPFIIDSSGRIIIGYTSALTTINDSIPAMQFVEKSLGFFSYSSGISSAYSIFFNKSISDVTGAHTLVRPYEFVGGAFYAASSSTKFLRCASINVYTDDVVTETTMSGRIVFSTTDPNTSTITNRFVINSYGNIAIGTSSAGSNVSLYIKKPVTGESSSYAIVSNGEIQPDVTWFVNFYSSSNTKASSFNLTSYQHFRAGQSSIGEGSSILSQVAFYADDTLLGGINNAAFYAGLPANSSYTITKVSSLNNIVTITTSTEHGFQVGQKINIEIATITGYNGIYVVNTVPTTTTLTYLKTSSDISLTTVTGTLYDLGRLNVLTSSAPSLFNGRVLISVSHLDAALRITQAGIGNSLVINDGTNDTTPFLIDNSGRVVIGHVNPIIGSYTQIPKLQVLGTTTSNASIQCINYNENSGYYPVLYLFKSNSSVIGNSSAVTEGSVLGNVIFGGSDGSKFLNSAMILAYATADSSTDNLPTALKFYTTRPGSGTVTETLRLTELGNVGIGSGADNVSLYVVKDITGDASAHGVLVSGEVQSDVTTAFYFDARSNVAANTNLENLYYFVAGKGTFGTGSSITSQIGFYASSALSDATTNIGFSSNLVEAANATITKVSALNNIVTATTSAAHGFKVGQKVHIDINENTTYNAAVIIATVPTTTTFTYPKTVTNTTETIVTGTAYNYANYSIWANTAPSWFNGKVVISTSNGEAALRVTQTGLGNSLLIEDTSNPDAAPFVINNIGNVGISTSAPTCPLQVSNYLYFGKGSGDAATASDIYMTDRGLIASGSHLYINSGASTSGSNIYFGNGAETINGMTYLMTISSNGYVGIGTTSPTRHLHIEGNSYLRHTITDPVSTTISNVFLSYPTYTINETSIKTFCNTYLGIRPIVNTGSINNGILYGVTIDALRNYNAENADDGGTSLELRAASINYGNYNSNSSTNPVVTNAFGLKIIPHTRTGSVENMYDIYLDGISLGDGTVTNKWGIYQESTHNNYFAGKIGLGIAVPTATLDINSNLFRVRTAKTVPTNNTTGDQGDICWDANYVYVCVATNTWKRAPLSSW